MRIVKHNIHKANASCNFCNRGELNRNEGISYPYSEVYSFQRDNGGGLLAFACEDCLKELSTALPTPASIEDEAEKLYPITPELGEFDVAKVQQAAHITCARMYLSRLAEMGELLMTKDGELDAKENEILELKAENSKMRNALEWYADAGNYLGDNGQVATAYTNDRIANKAIEALKPIAP